MCIRSMRNTYTNTVKRYRLDIDIKLVFLVSYRIFASFNFFTLRKINIRMQHSQ